jgi:tight adherence protein B
MVVILAALLAFIAVSAVGFVLATAGQGQRAAKRTQAIVSSRGRNEKVQRTSARSAQVDNDQRRRQIVRSLKDNERKQRAAAFSLSNRLHQAGLKIQVPIFCMGAGGLGVAVAGLAIFMHQKLLLALPMGFVAAVGFPLWVLGFLAKQRRAKFVLIFADAVDIIVRGIRSGLPLHDCLKVIGKESPEPLAGEFRWLVENLSLGMPIDQAMDKVVERMPVPELRFFAIVLNIQQKAGGNLGEALANLSAVVRSRRMMREKVKALASEAVASACIIGALPPIVMGLIQMTNPTYLSILFVDPRGHMWLAAGAVSMTIGIFVMRKMINFKI